MSGLLKPWLESQLFKKLNDANYIPLKCGQSLPLQIFKFLRFEMPIVALLSDTDYYIEAVFTEESIAAYRKNSEKRLTSLRGGIICLRRYFVYLSDVNQVISIRIVVNDFNYLGCEAGALYGDPKRIYASNKLCQLLQSPYLQALIAQAQPSVIVSNSSINSDLLLTQSSKKSSAEQSSNASLKISSSSLNSQPAFLWKTMTNLKLEDCLVPKEQQCLLRKKKSWYPSICDDLSSEETDSEPPAVEDEDVPVIKHEPDVSAADFSWSSSPDTPAKDQVKALRSVNADILNEALRKQPQSPVSYAGSHASESPTQFPATTFSQHVSNRLVPIAASTQLSAPQPVQSQSDLPPILPPSTIPVPFVPTCEQTIPDSIIKNPTHLQIAPPARTEAVSFHNESVISETPSKKHIMSAPTYVVPKAPSRSSSITFLRKALPSFDIDTQVQHALHEVYRDYCTGACNKKQLSSISNCKTLVKTKQQLMDICEGEFHDLHKNWLRIKKYRERMLAKV
ncbi:hypothetical protein SJAG_01378 [Schizosaccharomyces japonicus yFS275]|uniref:Shelterin complex subunit TPP1/Est3 domain-containing protein n=1 Tax=Schizosaccharomyces japonicus (strain yFS275 / FY16936) TaxID=402676 RepID=B6JXR7_SCHJY|nr:hypothetical protein SJAG_01378 [Schizosaccharomyces japonicus yFS275]EEB06335.1 hypothetical protein SJAG_01378 [Schizosaccharomyces japonicus yFS275]